MKKILSLTVSAILALTLIFSLAACSNSNDPWADAKYTKDTEIGTGDTTFYFVVKVDEHKVKFTVNTDKVIVGEALLDLGLIDGNVESYGLYVKKVNGIRADYDKDKAYWAFYVDGEYAMSGVDFTAIVPGETYEFVYTKD